ncbi:MAG: AI-2E family transporter [Acidimicrobiia bacterium]
MSDGDRRVHPIVERAAAYSWRLLVVALVAVGVAWLLGQLWVLVMALVLATFLTRALDGPARALRTRGLAAPLVAVVTLVGFLAVVGLFGWLVIPRVADEFESLGPTLTEAIDDVERWAVEDSPFDISQADVDDLRESIGDAVAHAFSSSGDSIVRSALVAVEVLTGLLLGLITTFFFLKDGPELQRWALDRVPAPHRSTVRRATQRGWLTVGAYLRGAASLGVVEGLIIGLALFFVGAELALPVAILTFAAAFVPIVGAVLAGAVAVLVALATAGFAEALIVLAVAVVVQQLDNDLLAPYIYGKALELHPLIVLFAVVGGGALFGFGGTILAVPVTAVAINVLVEVRAGPSAAAEPAGPPAAGSP